MVSSECCYWTSFLICLQQLSFTSTGLGFTTVLISHIAFCIPIVVIIVLPKLYEMNDYTLNAARDLVQTNFSSTK